MTLYKVAEQIVNQVNQSFYKSFQRISLPSQRKGDLFPVFVDLKGSIPSIRGYVGYSEWQ
jgi:hypothetical protein